MDKNEKLFHEIGEFIVNFEHITEEIRNNIYTLINYHFKTMPKNEIEFSVNNNILKIVIEKIEIRNLLIKFESLYYELFGQKYCWTKINLICKIIEKIIELRNIIAHGNWFISDIVDIQGLTKDRVSKKGHSINFLKQNSNLNELNKILFNIKIELFKFNSCFIQIYNQNLDLNLLDDKLLEIEKLKEINTKY
jgi:hypothetical protein